MPKFVTITIGGITQSVPEADLSLYLRAGYKVVEPEPAPVPDPLTDAPEAVAPVPAEKKSKK